MRFVLSILALLIFSVNLVAQEKCELNVSQSPSLQNLKLGMSPNEASQAIGLKFKIKADGQRSFFQNYINKKAKGKLTGIRALFLRFYNNELYQIEIFYEDDFRWQSLENLTKDYSSNQNFPNEFWEIEYGYAKAVCQNFTLDADFILNPHIQITNDAILKLIEQEKKT